MTINLHLPSHSDTLKPKITVIGVGGAGGNAVNNMIAANLEGVDFVIANTDAQALESAMTDRTVQLGVTVTRGLGAGANPQVGQAAAEEAIDDIADHIQGSNMVFITAGMGGGTGTGAAPVIAQLAREQGILTVGVVTKPFSFEGIHRMRMAEKGLEELQQYVDTLIVIPNQNLFRIANEKTTFAEAFCMADEVLHSGVRGVTDLMVKPGLVNLDFADIRAVMSEMGKAMMGTGEASGDQRAKEAAESAISNPLLDDVSLRGARAVLINITGGPDMTLFEVDEAANRIRDEVDPDANIIFGSTFSDALEGKMRVSVVATGIEGEHMVKITSEPARTTHAVGQVPSAPVAHPQGLRQPEKLAKPTAANSGFGNARVNNFISQQAAKRQEPVRERTAAEIVRESSNASVAEMARMAAERSKQVPIAQPVSPTTARHAAPVAQAPQPQSAQLQTDMFGHAIEPSSFVSDEPAIEQGHGAASPRPLTARQDSEPALQQSSHFVPPMPEMPTRRTAMMADASMHSEDSAPAASGLNFFQKIAGVGKAFAARQQEMDDDLYEDEPAPRQSAARVRAKQVEPVAAAPAREDEDYLEIPAFLRRQAN